MPKTKQSLKAKLNLIVQEHINIFKTDGSVLYCKICEKNVSVERKSQIDQHLVSIKHKELISREKNKQQQFLTQSSFNTPNVFFEDLCRAFISSDIPLHKLANPNLKSFLAKYTSKAIPDETTLRKSYVKKLYDSEMEKIRIILQNKKIWVSIDETTDEAGRYIANVIVGILSENEELSQQKFLLNVEHLSACNHSTIATLFDNSIRLLGENFQRDQVLIFITDAAPYMVKAGEAIKIFYPKLIHLTCVVHAIHRVAEEIRSNFKKVDRLISIVKKIFLKAPLRVQIFKEKEPDLALPPQPILTRWGTWLGAAEYYAKNFSKIKYILELLNEEDSAFIIEAKQLMKESFIENDLVFLLANYCHIKDKIKVLESSKLSLIQQIYIVQNLKSDVEKNESDVGRKIANKFNKVLSKNEGFKVLEKVALVLEHKLPGSNILQYTPEEIAVLKYLTITSVEVERSFSLYNSFFRKNRQSFSFENLKHHLVVYCNANLN